MKSKLLVLALTIIVVAASVFVFFLFKQYKNNISFSLSEEKAKAAFLTAGYNIQTFKIHKLFFPNDKAYVWRDIDDRIFLSSSIYTDQKNNLNWKIYINNKYLSKVTNQNQEVRTQVENNINKIVLNSFFASSPKASTFENVESAYPELLSKNGIVENKIFTLKP